MDSGTEAGPTGAAVIRCAPYHEGRLADPVGSAGHYDAFLVVEVPLPWGRDISSSEPFATLAGGGPAASLTGADGRRWRPMGVVPPTASGDPDRVRVTAWERPGAGPVDGVSPADWQVHRGGPFSAREWTVPPEDLVASCRAVLDGSAPPSSARPEVLPEAAGFVDLLVCTHGRRDVCCGGSGSLLFAELADRSADLPGVRVRRCSHTGGHRFAPTALTFPDGYAWAHLDVATATAVARRAPGDEVPVASCRGASSLPGGPWQALDREGLACGGWAWAAGDRELVLLDGAEPGPVTIEARAAGDAGPVVHGRVEVGRLVPMPACGAGDDADAPTEPEWRVTGVRSGRGGASGPAQ